MKRFEVGKTYNTRDGEYIAKITKIFDHVEPYDGDPQMLISGDLFDHNGAFVRYGCWTVDGYDLPGHLSGLDLISEPRASVTDNLIDRVSYLLNASGDCSVEKRLLHVTEELGELSRAQRDFRNGKGTAEHRLEESVDLLITSISAFVTAGGTIEDLEKIFWKKCDKWEKNIKDKKA